MKKKVLIIANTASMILLFNRTNIDILEEAGYEVHVACNFIKGNTTSKELVEKSKMEWDKEGITEHHVPFPRTLLSFEVFKIYKQIRALLKKEQYDIVHCHTPIVSAITKLATIGLKKTKVVHTVHGFHFFKGAPIKKWIMYYPIEKILAHLTDVMITINSEDYRLAKKHFNAKQIVYVQGVGVDTEAIAGVNADRDYLRKELGIPKDNAIAVSVGELRDVKNHMTAVKALAECKSKNVHYVIAGIGKLREDILSCAKELGIEDRVHLLGFRTDIAKVLKGSDFFIFPSLREGLPVALMEAMAAGLPAIVSNTRGIRDLISEKGGFYFEPMDYKLLSKHIDTIVNDEQLREKMGTHNQRKVKHFDKSIIKDKLEDVLNHIEGNKERQEEKVEA